MTLSLAELDWKYNIPRCFTYEIKRLVSCPVCKCLELDTILPPYLFSTAIIIDITEAINNDFGYNFTEEELMEHKKHIKRNIVYDSVQNIGKVNKSITDKDIVAKCNVEKALQSALNSLYARKLEMEKNEEFGKDYLLLMQQLKGFIELQSKIDGKIKENELNICLSDLIPLKGAIQKKI